MPAVDPTYPLFSVACILSSALLLLTLTTSFVRQSWNLGVTFLCFWLFWENLTYGINAVVWSDNYEVKLYVYFDIVSHLQMITSVVKPMCTLIIIRRLYLIASLRSVELPSIREKRKNMVIEWTLGLIIPLLVAGPFYYVNQGSRFQVLEGFGCNGALDGSILTDLLIYTWPVILPLISLLVYYPKVLWVFYRQRRDTNRFLQSNTSVSRTNYFRILALASIDILITLPFGVLSLVIVVVQEHEFYHGHVAFYNGWSFLHSDWAPLGAPYADFKSEGAAFIPQLYFNFWTSPLLALIIFGLFGLTADARATYWRAISFVAQWFGWKPAPQKSEKMSALGAMKFGARPQEILLDAELGSRPSFVNFESIAPANTSGTSYGDKEIQELPLSDDLDHNASNRPGEHANNRTTVDTPSREESEV